MTDNQKSKILARLFLRKSGKPYKSTLEKLLQRYQKKVRCTCVQDWLAGQ